MGALKENQPGREDSIQITLSPEDQLSLAYTLKDPLYNMTRAEAHGDMDPEMIERFDRVRRFYQEIIDPENLMTIEKVSMGLIDWLTSEELEEVIVDDTLGSTGTELIRIAEYLLTKN